MKLSYIFKQLLSSSNNNQQIFSLITDNKLLLCLKDCFMQKKFKQNYQITLFTQLSRMPRLKDELMGLSLDLATSLIRKYFKNQRNYSENSQLMKLVKKKAKSFIVLTNAQKKMLIRQNWRGCSQKKQVTPYCPKSKFKNAKDFGMKRKQFLLIDYSQQIRNKSYYCSTKSSINKRYGHEGLQLFQAKQDTKRSFQILSNYNQPVAKKFGLWQSQQLTY